MDYQTVQQRRAKLGAGIIELHKQAGISDDKYGVGLWCQNRREWQLMGRRLRWRYIAEVADPR